MKDKYIKLYVAVGSFILFLLIINIFIWKVVYDYNVSNKDKAIDNIIQLETIENKIYNRDSIINDYKNKFEYEKEKIVNANDSDVFMQFKSYISK